MSAPKEQEEALQPSRDAVGDIAGMSVDGDGLGSPLARVPALKAHDTPASPTAQKIGHWIHTHKDLPQSSFLGFTGYQYIRSCIAAVPYGMSMALTLAGLTWAERKGGAMADQAAAGTFKHATGSRLKQFASAPAVKTSALVATSFTLYRGTSKTVKWLTEYLFNSRDSEEKTVAKVRDLPHETWRKIKEVAPAEVSSTPVAALVLGFVASFFNKGGYPAFNKESKTWELKGAVPPELDFTHANFIQQKGARAKLGLLKNVILHPKARFLEHLLVNTTAYSLFFEMGDRLYKDKQIRRDVWPGDPYSTKALKATPDAYVEGLQRQDEIEQGKYAESAKDPTPTHKHYGAFTNEPSVTRFAFRRVLPTALGIGAYTAFKFRHAYMLGGDFVYKPGPLLKQIPGKALLEGAATSLFFLIPWVAEPWEKAYDKFWENMEKRAAGANMQSMVARADNDNPAIVAQNDNGGDNLARMGGVRMSQAAQPTQAGAADNDNLAKAEADPRVQQNYAELLQRLNAKEAERGGARVA